MATARVAADTEIRPPRRLCGWFSTPDSGLQTQDFLVSRWLNGRKPFFKGFRVVVLLEKEKRSYSAGMGAAFGQTSAQSPQSVQVSGSMTAFVSPIVMLPLGQPSMQSPVFWHLSVIMYVKIEPPGKFRLNRSDFCYIQILSQNRIKFNDRPPSTPHPVAAPDEHRARLTATSSSRPCPGLSRSRDR